MAQQTLQQHILIRISAKMARSSSKKLLLAKTSTDELRGDDGLCTMHGVLYVVEGDADSIDPKVI